MAEEDLRLRGPGELAGVRQAGLGGPLPLAPGTDDSLLEEAVRTARRLVTDGAGEAAPTYYTLLGSSLDPAASHPGDAV